MSTVGSPQLVLGVEGGATKTEWIYFERNEEDHWKVLQAGRLSGANFKLISSEGLTGLMDQLPKEASHVGIYLPGVLGPAECTKLQTLASEVWPSASISTGSDLHSGMATAFQPSDSGIFVISGTGSSITGRHGNRITSVGGKGHLISDKGSAYHIAMEGLRLVMDRFDETEAPCPLAKNVLAYLELGSVDDLVDWVHHADKPTIARLATIVFETYQQGDHQLLDILKSGVESLAYAVTLVAKKLDMADVPLKVAVHGSMFTKQPLYVRLFEDALTAKVPNARVVVCEASGAVGAAHLAVMDVAPLCDCNSVERDSLDERSGNGTVGKS